MKDFERDNGGAVTVYLRDFDGSGYTELGSGTLSDTPWQGGSSWVQKTFRFPVETYTIAPGHSLELKVIVEGSSADDMWFAYDTNDHKSRVAVSASSSVTAGSGGLPSSLLACWLPQIRARYLFD
jgi:hypothetical protein